jgi:diguanylate cyclase (GGDEF)-like protein
MGERHILLLEDEVDITESVRLSLKSRGYNTSTSADIEEGINLYRRFRPSIILMDMNIHGSTDFIKEIKKLNNDNIEVILFLNENSPYCPDLGALRYLRKPFDLEDLLCSVKEAEDKIELRDERNRFLMELMEYSEGLEQMVEKKTAELITANDRLRTLSVTDDLTGAYNRRYFFERLEQEINKAARHGYPISVMLIDIDNFKSINDYNGHLIGDAVLKEFAYLLKRNLRRGDTVARYGGEEFAAILSHTTISGALKAGEIIREKVESTNFSDGINITVSVGVAEVDMPIKNTDEGIAKADMALYVAKKAGKNKVCSWPVDNKKE